MESDLKKEIKKLFPLQVESENVDLGMGERGLRYKISTNNGSKICYSDYEPSNIRNINMMVNAAISELI